jgi:oligoribonuclease (3'-5' exoribonuclease)
MAYPKHMCWVDLETTGLDKDTEILEIGVIITDMELTALAEYEAALELTGTAIHQLKANDFVMKMHLESGLLKLCKYSTKRAADVQFEIIDKLIAAGASPQEVMIAGSGVAMFDFDIIKNQMPDLAEWLVYFPIDVGISRRIAHIATGGRNVFPKVEASFKEGVKAHRAMGDIEAHLEEARGQFAVLRSLPTV